MPYAKQARRNNIVLANAACAQRPSSAPPPPVRAADVGAVDEANLSQAATARAVEPAAAASGAAGAADAMAAAESSSGGLDSSCALERSSSTPSPAPLPTGGAEPMAPGSDELDGCEADGESDAPPQARMISALEEAELFPLLRGLQVTQRTLLARAPPSAPLDYSHGSYLVRLNLVQRFVGFQVTGVSYGGSVTVSHVMLGRGAPGPATSLACVCNEAFEDDEIADIARRIRAGQLTDLDATLARSFAGKPTREAALAAREACVARRERELTKREEALAAREADWDARAEGGAVV